MPGLTSEAEAMAKALILERLEWAVSHRQLFELKAPLSAWGTDLLGESDLSYLNKIGVRWSDNPEENDILRLIDEEFAELREQGVGLAFHRDAGIGRRIRFIGAMYPQLST